MIKKMKMYIKMKKNVFLLLVVGMFLSSAFLYGCGEKKTDVNENDETENAEETETSSVTEQSQEPESEQTQQEEVHIDVDELADYASDFSLVYDAKSKQMTYSLTMPQIPESDDAYLYLFALECYEDEAKLPGKPVAYGPKALDCEVAFKYEEKYLFEQFIPALLIDGKYVSVGSGIYLSNPEALADNKEAYPELDSKKGILIDPTMLGTKEMTELGIKHAVYNIPLSHIMGETSDQGHPTIVYIYKGHEYYFNGAIINAYDGLFTYLTQMGICSTAIVLNDWNDDYIEMIHPKARDKNSEAFYYMFNTAEMEGVNELEAVASFLTERYCGGEHGMVYNWVIANEINQFKTWNYMNTDDVEYYAQEFEKAFRIFYQAAKSRYANSKVYFSIDHDWNSNNDDIPDYFNGRELLTAFNDIAVKHGNYDWGIAVHPYPDPLTRVNYWSQEYDKTQDAPILSIMNLSVLTDFLKQEAYLDTKGDVRSITITELGFSSVSGEKLQAAAFAYCYYILDANPYIDAFILNRQTDAPEELLYGLAFGIYEYDHSKKYLREVFCYIDTKQASEYTDFMLNILGADTLEEALSWVE